MIVEIPAPNHLAARRLETRNSTINRLGAPFVVSTDCFFSPHFIQHSKTTANRSNCCCLFYFCCQVAFFFAGQLAKIVTKKLNNDDGKNRTLVAKQQVPKVVPPPPSSSCFSEDQTNRLNPPPLERAGLKHLRKSEECAERVPELGSSQIEAGD